jgi:hypothetical protein
MKRNHALEFGLKTQSPFFFTNAPGGEAKSPKCRARSYLRSELAADLQRKNRPWRPKKIRVLADLNINEGCEVVDVT